MTVEAGWGAWWLGWARGEARAESIVLLVMMAPVWVWLDTRLWLGWWVFGPTGYFSGVGGRYYRSPLAELYPWLDWWGFAAGVLGCWILARRPARRVGVGMCLGMAVSVMMMTKDLSWALYGMQGWVLRSGGMKYTMMMHRGWEDSPGIVNAVLGLGLAWLLWKASNNAGALRRVSGFYVVLGAAAPLMWWWSLRMKNYPGFEWIIDFWSAWMAGWMVMALICVWCARRMKARFWEDAREMIGRGRVYCVTCGYDLRGTRMAGLKKCPECGAGGM